jgi:hypothetical protein
VRDFVSGGYSRAVTSDLEREMPIALAIRAAATSLLQGDADPAASLPQETPRDRCARQFTSPLHTSELSLSNFRGLQM